MKDSVTLLTVCFFASMLIGCSKELSGTYKHKESSQIIEFAGSKDFIIRYPDSAVIDGTYKKTDGYELYGEAGSVIALAKKDGKSFVMNGNRYVKQKEKSKIPVYLFVIYCIGTLLLYIWIHWFCMSENTTFEIIATMILVAIFWPIGFVLFLIVLVPILLFVLILFIITGGKLIDVT